MQLVTYARLVDDATHTAIAFRHMEQSCAWDAAEAAEAAEVMFRKRL